MQDSDSGDASSHHSLEDAQESSDEDADQSSDDNVGPDDMRRASSDPSALSAAFASPFTMSGSVHSTMASQVSTSPGIRRLDELLDQDAFAEEFDITKNPMWIARAKRLESKWRCYDARLVPFSRTRDVRKHPAQPPAAGDLGVVAPAALSRSLRYRLNGASSRCAAHMLINPRLTHSTNRRTER